MQSTTRPSPAPRPRRIGFLLIEGFALMSYAAAIEPLRAANLLSEHPLFAISHYAMRGRAACASSGAVVACEGEAGDPATLDILLVCAGGNPFALDDARTFAWLRRLARMGVTLGGISGGPVILARAGVMEGRRMTVHWEHAAEFVERHPSLALSRALYVVDRNRITCGGGTAPMDMMHALIAEYHGPAFARTVSDWFLHTQVRAAGGAQRPGVTERYGVQHADLVAALELMENHIADPLPLERLAGHVGLSDRQLRRLFRDRLGAAPADIYRDIRLDHARALLRQTTLPVTEIGLACGFSSGAHFAAAFRRRFGSAPTDTRRAAKKGPGPQPGGQAPPE